MKIGLDMPGGKIPQSKYSHNAGMALVLRHQLEFELGQKVDILSGEPWSDYDVIYLYHGMTFKGSLNLFGGATEENAKFYERLLTPNIRFVSLDIPMPDYGELCSSRKTCDDYWATIDWNKISEVCKNIHYEHHACRSTKLILGDSHSISAYLPGYMVIRKDGRTLKGALRKTLSKEIVGNGIPVSILTHLTLYFGNIDIRHHLCRESDPKEAINILITEYEKQILELGIPNIEIIAPLPIELETRKLPKTGYFDGTPFYGSREERDEVRQYFSLQLTQMCLRNNWLFSLINDVLYEVSVIEYMNEYMERPKSIHISPLYYRTDFWKKKSIIKF
jgi:hypothetical protein